MKVKKRHIIYGIFLMLFFYGVNSEIFERKFLFNEILSLIGIFIFLRESFRSKGKFKLPKSGLYRVMLAYLLLAGVHLILSIFWKTNWYFYLRNAVIFYAAFTFFLGFYYYEEAKAFYQKARWGMAAFFAFAFAFPRPSLLMDRYNATVFFPFLFFGRNLHHLLFWGGFLILCLVYTLTYVSSTIILTVMLLSLIMYLRYYFYLKTLFIVGFLGFLFFFISLMPALKLYRTGEYRLFGNVHYVYQQSKLLQVDYNSSWRLILWYRVSVERFPDNLFGLGYGTPLIEYKKGYDTAQSNHDDEHDAHVIGVHNTYLTTAVRLGVFYLFILYAIYHNAFKEYYKYRRYYIYTQDVLFMLGFFAVSIIGIFNLVIESPTVAALYWTFLGFVAKIIYNRKRVFQEKRLAKI